MDAWKDMPTRMTPQRLKPHIFILLALLLAGWGAAALDFLVFEHRWIQDRQGYVHVSGNAARDVSLLSEWTQAVLGSPSAKPCDSPDLCQALWLLRHSQAGSSHDGTGLPALLSFAGEGPTVPEGALFPCVLAFAPKHSPPRV